MTIQQRKSARFIRKTLMGISLIGLLCLLITGAVLFSNSRLPDASTTPTTLSSEQVAFLEETLHLKMALGDALWSGFGGADIPLLSFNERYAFLCAYDKPPEGWEELADTTVNNRPCYRQEWQDGQNFTEEIGQKWVSSLTTQEWGKIRLRTLMREELPPVLGDLAGPWMAREMLKPHRYLGGMVHESFHAFQATTNRAFFDNAELAYADDRRYWTQDSQQTAAWEEEIAALYNAVKEADDAEAARLAQAFFDQRDRRRQQHLASEPELVRYEQRYEWLEGLAKYAELRIQRLACDTPDYTSVDTMQPVEGFDGYCAIDGFWEQELSQMKRQAAQEGNVRFYYTGWAQALLLDRFAGEWKDQAMAGAYLDDLLRDALAAE